MSTFGEKILPTKINLIRLRRELAMLRRIRRVLEEKRDVLLLYIRQVAREYREAYEKAAQALEEAYKFYFTGVSQVGVETLKPVIESIPATLTVEVGTRILFAIKTPTLSLVRESIPEGVVALTRMSPSIMEARDKLCESLENLLKLVETEVTIRLLLRELRETQRLLNALDYSIIPRYEQAIKYIKLVLDDRLREDIMRLKNLKKRLEARRRGAG